MLSSEGRKLLLSMLRDELSRPWSLLSLARGQIRQTLGVHVTQKVEALPLPSMLKNYLVFKSVDELDLSDLDISIDTESEQE